MTEKINSQFGVLSGGEREPIQNNLNSLKKALFTLRNRFATAIGMANYFEVMVLSLNHFYLTQEFGIALVDALGKPGVKLT